MYENESAEVKAAVKAKLADLVAAMERTRAESAADVSGERTPQQYHE
jgi:hypothetical protein